MVVKWLMRKIDTEKGVSNFSSGGRVVIVVMVGVMKGYEIYCTPFWMGYFIHSLTTCRDQCQSLVYQQNAYGGVSRQKQVTTVYLRSG